MKRRPKEIPYIPKDRRGSRYAPREGGKILRSAKGVEALRETNADAWGKRDKKAQNGCGCLIFLAFLAVTFGGQAGDRLLDSLLELRTDRDVAEAPAPAPIEEKEAAPPVADLPPPTADPFTPPIGNFAGLFSTDDYPARELAQGVEGTVRASLVVDTGGRVAECRVVVSSESSALDARTCEIFSARARFEPARDADGNPLRASIDAPPVAWTIPE